MFYRYLKILFPLAAILFSFSCKEAEVEEPKVAPVALRTVPAQRLNYRFETDVPAPELKAVSGQIEERNEAVQADFDQNRPQEVLDRTITSPDKSRVLAVYRKAEDEISEFRLDMYSAAGKLLRKITHDEMAVHFPGTIVWSPDSTNAVFIAMVRGQVDPSKTSDNPTERRGFLQSSPTPSPTPADVNSNTANEGESESNEVPDPGESPEAEPTPVLEPPKNVLTFRTEQIYICGSDGSGVKPLTQNEGLMYFYAVWAPDSSAIVALASPFTEWRIREYQMGKSGERFVPSGRPRLIEKNGRERLLDDYPTAVHPVWSPDSAKVAVAFDKQVRVYDAIGDQPTQAAIPLRNSLLLASKAYEEGIRKKEEANANVGNTGNSASNENAEPNETSEANSNSNANVNANAPTSTLPDASTLASFNPIIAMSWDDENMLYVETGYVKEYIDDEAENRRSYLRWHRLIFSPQAVALQKPQQPGQ